MKIFFLVRTLHEKRGGGSHHNAIAQVRALRSLGHEVSVHSFVAGGNMPPRDIEVAEHDAPEHFRAANRYLVGLLRAYEKDADVFFLYGADFSWAAGVYRKTGGCTPVAVYLDTYLAAMRQGRVSATYYLKRLFWDKLSGLRLTQHVDVYMAVSPFVRDTYARFGFPADRVVVIPNFFDFIPAPSRLPAKEVRLLYTGRLIYEKGPDLLLRALQDMRELPWRVRLVGEGPMLAQCRSLAANFEDRIEFYPWVEQAQLLEHYAWADVFVHPARWPEPFGRTIVEALRAGLPAIVPQNGGASWIAGNAGLAFQNGSPSSLSIALRQLLVDRALRARLTALAVTEASRFSTKEIVPQLEEALAKIAK